MKLRHIMRTTTILFLHLDKKKWKSVILVHSSSTTPMGLASSDVPAHLKGVQQGLSPSSEQNGQVFSRLHFAHWSTVMLKQERAFSKLLHYHTIKKK